MIDPTSRALLSQHGVDVAILGGGPAGCATALALLDRGVERVLVIEAGRGDGPRVGESIPPATNRLLARLGLWDAFVEQRHEPCRGSCSAWGRDRLGYNDFLFDPLGHGWHLDRERFDALLARRAADRGATVWTGARFVRAEALAADEVAGEGGFLVRLASGASAEAAASLTAVRARFVVDATGPKACFARARSASRVFLDRLVCAYGFFGSGSGSGPAPGLGSGSGSGSGLGSGSGFPALTVLEATEYGWWYGARLPRQRLAVAVATDPEILRERGLGRREGWLAHLAETRHLSQWLDRESPVEGDLVLRAAPTFRLDRVGGPRWRAVGDAAAAYDPLSSQGIHKALEDGLEAAEEIARALAVGGTLSEGEHFEHVARRFEGYLADRNYFYGLETRWSGAPFWARRQEQGAAWTGRSRRTLEDRR